MCVFVIEYLRCLVLVKTNSILCARIAWLIQAALRAVSQDPQLTCPQFTARRQMIYTTLFCGVTNSALHGLEEVTDVTVSKTIIPHSLEYKQNLCLHIYIILTDIT